MPRPWTEKQKRFFRRELVELYIKKNLSIREIGKLLGLAESGVYDRLLRLDIKPIPSQKKGFLNKRAISFPKYSEDLAEIVGILLGDGHISSGQIWFTLGSKEQEYSNYINLLFSKVFGYQLKISITNKGYTNLFIGFIALVKYFKKMGLVQNKVKYQVGVPSWILKNKKYYSPCLRGLFDTDGSVYKIRSGYQISFKNMSFVLLKDIRKMLLVLGFSASQISNFSVYITKKEDLRRFREVIGSNNPPKFSRLVTWTNIKVVP